MSEEILKALMQLFAIISKQDDGVTEVKINFVSNFLTQQVGNDQVDQYMTLFSEFTKDKKRKRQSEAAETSALASITDALRILSICRKINKTLTQPQKVVVLVRLFELVKADHNFSKRRMVIIETVSQIFKIDWNEFTCIKDFIIKENPLELDQEDILILGDRAENLEKAHFIPTEDLDKYIVILYVKSVNLYFLGYHGSSNVLLNGLSLKNNSVYLFANGSNIKLPHGKTIYYSDVASAFLSAQVDAKLSFNVNNLNYHFKNGNIGLRDFNFSEGPGKLVGIMGASGAGKTTLLNVLAGLETPSSGEVLINGSNLHTEKEKLKGVIGYVPQDDLLIEELTVFENLYYNAKLCFKNKSNEEIQDLCNQTLLNLGLQKTAGLKVGSPLEKTISGGQRKRLNIALELIREPAVLFLDEPTSGLSSKDSENIMDLLREITLKGKLIFVVIHQPSSEIYKAFDKMLFLDTGGYLIYNGNPVEAVSYFKRIDQQVNSEQGECITCGNVNPETVFNIIEAKVVDEYGNLTQNRKVGPESWTKHFKENFRLEKEKDETVAPAKTLHIPTKINQFLVFLTRDFKAKISNKQYVLINLIETPVLALFLSFLIRYNADPSTDYIFRDNENVPAYILMCIVVALFVGLTVSAEEIFKDRKILKRESFLNLSRFSYLLSKISLLFTLSAFQSLFLVLIGNSILGIRGMYFEYWLVLFSISCFANVLGLNISNSFNSAVTIYILIPLLIIPQMVLAGAMFSFDKLNKAIGGGHHVPFIAELMPSRWAYEGLVVNQFMENDYQRLWYHFDQKESEINYKLAYYIPELQSITEKSVDLQQKQPDSKQLKTDIELLRTELIKEAISNKIKPFKELKGLSVDSFNQEVAKNIYSFLDRLSDHYNQKNNVISEQKELKMEKMTASMDLKQLRNQYDNDYVTELVTNALAKNKIIQEGNELTQVLDPVYQKTTTPTLASFDRPFYSPNKYIFNFSLSTFAFNIIIIWIMTILFFIALYFNLLTKFMFILGEVSKTKKPQQS